MQHGSYAGGHDPVRQPARAKVPLLQPDLLHQHHEERHPHQADQPRLPGLRPVQDLITYGFREKYYTEARERGVIFLRYDEDDPPQV